MIQMKNLARLFLSLLTLLIYPITFLNKHPLSHPLFAIFRTAIPIIIAALLALLLSLSLPLHYSQRIIPLTLSSTGTTYLGPERLNWPQIPYIIPSWAAGVALGGVPVLCFVLWWLWVLLRGDHGRDETRGLEEGMLGNKAVASRDENQDARAGGWDFLAAFSGLLEALAGM